MSQGSFYQLAAKGPQERMFYGDDETSIDPFRHCFKRSTPFALDQREEPFPDSFGLGAINTLTIPRIGDLLGNVVLEFYLPEIAGAGPGDRWVDGIGYVLLRRIRFLIDDIELSDSERLWYDISDKLFTKATHRRGLEEMIGKGAVLHLNRPHVIHVPLKLLCCKAHRATQSFLPIVSTPGSSMRLEIEGESFDNCTIREDGKVVDSYGVAPTSYVFRGNGAQNSYADSDGIFLASSAGWTSARYTLDQGAAGFDIQATFVVPPQGTFGMQWLDTRGGVDGTYTDLEATGYVLACSVGTDDSCRVTLRLDGGIEMYLFETIVWSGHQTSLSGPDLPLDLAAVRAGASETRMTIHVVSPPDDFSSVSMGFEMQGLDAEGQLLTSMQYIVTYKGLPRRRAGLGLDGQPTSYVSFFGQGADVTVKNATVTAEIRRVITAPSNTATPTHLECKVILEYVWLGNAERERMINRPHEMLVEVEQDAEALTYKETISSGGNARIPLDNVKVDLSEVSYPVKAVTWVSYATNALSTKSYFTYTDDIKQSLILLDGVERFRPMTQKYFELLQRYHCSNTSESTGDNVYLYSFALDCRSWQPSGHLNFGAARSTLLDITLTQKRPDRVVKAFILGYRLLVVSKGRITFKF
jgi:hypothetical protein